MFWYRVAQYERIGIGLAWLALLIFFIVDRSFELWLFLKALLATAIGLPWANKVINKEKARLQDEEEVSEEEVRNSHQ